MTRGTLAIAVVWTAFIAVAVGLSLRAEQRSAVEAATVAARSQFVKDVIYRRWNAEMGGVYAPVTERVQPNPHLGGRAERDIVTRDGRTLTLINPAYMTRMVHELGFESEDVRGHITSLDPIRPENAPDDWEVTALRSFEQSIDEASEVQTIDGRKYLRLMRPLLVEESCLACHAKQGYEVGDVRGGISVGVPLDEYVGIAQSNFRATAVGYAVTWLLGMGAIAIGGRRLALRSKGQVEAEDRVERLLSERELMLREVQHRIKNNMATMASLLSLKAHSLPDESARAALAETSAKFRAMMVTYDRLYRSVDCDSLSLAESLPTVARQIVQGSSAGRSIAIDVDVDDIVVDSSTASTLGILTAEAVTNAVKHAFPNGRAGTLTLSAHRVGPTVELLLADDGVGFPRHVDLSGGSGLGLALIPALASQLDGEATIESSAGTRIHVRFPYGDAVPKGVAE